MPTSLDARLDALAGPGRLPDDTPCRIISVKDMLRLSDESGQTGRSVEIAALQNGIIPERYLRNRQSLSAADQIQLLQSRVGIVGLGGLGGLVTEALARIGVGGLSLIDGDIFESHNLNRQLLSSTENLGVAKAEAAAERVAAINPSIEVSRHTGFLTATNAADMINGCDLVIDCLDNIRSRFTLQSAARRAHIPMISAAVAGLSGHVTAIFPNDRGLEAIYGPEDQLVADKGEETRLGNLAPGVNLIASLESAEALKILLGRPHALKNRLLMVDLTDYTFDTLQLT